jgi:hypothetical protein
VLALLGHKSWWLPRPLDNLLPNLDIEGSTMQQSPFMGRSEVHSPPLRLAHQPRLAQARPPQALNRRDHD